MVRAAALHAAGRRFESVIAYHFSMRWKWWQPPASLSFLALHPHEALGMQGFGNLHRVESSSLKDLISDDPEAQPVVEGEVFA